MVFLAGGTVGLAVGTVVQNSPVVLHDERIVPV
jgi:hypothetical protein